MNKKGKALIGILVVLLVALIVWAVRTVPAPPASPGQPQTMMKYDGNTIKEEKDGRVIWELSAEQIDMDTKTQDASLTNIKVPFIRRMAGVWSSRHRMPPMSIRAATSKWMAVSR